MEHSGASRPVIDSRSNPTVQFLRDLHDASGRRERGAFLIEGTRLVGEAVNANWPLMAALYDVDRIREDVSLSALIERIPAAQPATARAIKHAAETVSPQGIVAAAAIPDRLAGVNPSEPLVLVLDGLSDPGNVGTLLRSALGAGVRTVFSTPGSVDLFSPKVVRAAMGAHFRLRVAPDLEWEAAKALLGSYRRIVVAETGGETRYYDYDWRVRSALVVGSEAHGSSARAKKLATARVSIPIAPALESLNAAIAASIIMFEAKRQRNEAST